MARRRLNTILATTTLAAGLSVAPAWGQSLGDLTDTVEETVTETTEVVEDTTETVTDTVEETTEEVSDTLDPSDTDSGGDSGDTDVTEDAPLDVDLEVDVAPEDEDGSPQLEVDGGVTVGDQTVDVGSVTDPVEDAIDPDPDPEPSPSPDSNEPDDHQTDTSSDSRERDTDTSTGSRLGGLVEGGGVTAAGGNMRAADVPGSGSNDGDRRGRTVGESFAAFAANNRGSSWSRGGSGSTTGSTNSSEIAPPRVADPADPSFEQFPASQVEEPTVLATPAATGDPTSPMAGLLKSLAALMVLGTGVAFKRTLDEA